MKTKGTYQDVVFSTASNKKLDSIIKHINLEKDFTDAYHCTITYSKIPVPYLKTSKDVKQDKTGNAVSKISKLATIKSFGHFKTPEGKNLHVELECDWLNQRFIYAKSKGAISDYDEYTPHITLLYNCTNIRKNFDIEQIDMSKFIGQKIEIVEERISPLNENWVEDSSTDKDKK